MDVEAVLRKTEIPFGDKKLLLYSIHIPPSLCEPLGKKRGWLEKRRERRRMQRLVLMLDEAFGKVSGELQENPITYLYLSKELERRLEGENGFWQERDTGELIDKLYEVCLWNSRKRNKETTLSLSMPEECGELTTARLFTIIKPYLSRINLIVFVGTENAQSQRLEDYLYEEYGIVMSYERFPARNTVWIDLDDKQDQILTKYAKENGICHINRAEVLKFLDTAAKNGYNAKVN